MSENGNLDALIERVLAKARQEAEAFVDRARKAAEREVSQAGEQARQHMQAAEAAVRSAAAERRRAVEAEARQAERRALMNAREAAVEAVFADALQVVGHVAATERRALLVKLVGEGVRALRTDRVRVRLNAVEQALAREPGFPREIEGAAVTIDDEAIKVSGGPVVSDETGRVFFENTFEARLDRARESLRRRVAEMLGLSEG